jgi:DNA-binding transcriptional ArsR family regulator
MTGHEPQGSPGRGSRLRLDGGRHAEQSTSQLGDPAEVLWLLSDPARVATLRCLREASEDLEVRALAACTAPSIENDEAGVETRLHHAVLPQLDDAGLIRYDADGLLLREVDTERIDELLGLYNIWC